MQPTGELCRGSTWHESDREPYHVSAETLSDTARTLFSLAVVSVPISGRNAEMIGPPVKNQVDTTYKFGANGVSATTFSETEVPRHRSFVPSAKESFAYCANSARQRRIFIHRFRKSFVGIVATARLTVGANRGRAFS